MAEKIMAKVIFCTKTILHKMHLFIQFDIIFTCFSLQWYFFLVIERAVSLFRKLIVSNKKQLTENKYVVFVYL